MKRILIGICTYLGYFALTLLFFYVFGVYSFTTFPSRLVLFRILFFPVILTFATLLLKKIIWMKKK